MHPGTGDDPAGDEEIAGREIEAHECWLMTLLTVMSQHSPLYAQVACHGRPQASVPYTEPAFVGDFAVSCSPVARRLLADGQAGLCWHPACTCQRVRRRRAATNGGQAGSDVRFTQEPVN